MKKPKVVYLDNCAWQSLAGDAYAGTRHCLDALRKDNAVRFAWSLDNVAERIFGIDCNHPLSKRVRTAQVMLDLVSMAHLFRDLKPLLDTGNTERPFYAYDDPIVGAAWRFLEELARPVPQNPRSLRCAQGLRNRMSHSSASALQGRLDGIGGIRDPQGKLLSESLGSLTDEHIVEVLREVFEGEADACTLYRRAHALLALRKSKSGKPLDAADTYDMAHVVFGQLADLFVTEDAALVGLAKTLRDELGEGDLICLSLKDSLEALTSQG